MMDKVSIIIPVYNTEKYLEKCIKSVCNQTYQNLEIICVDDGSTDESGRILDRFAQVDKRIKVMHKANEGVSAARNDGLRIATGEWIGFVDSDDYIAEDMYEIMLKSNENHRADIISCGYYMDYVEYCVVAANKKEVPTEAVETKQFLRYIYERDCYKGVASYLWTRLISRELLYCEDASLRHEFSKDFDVSEDLVFLAEVMQESKYSLYVEKPMYHYLQRENSACHDEKKQLATLSWVRAYLRIIEILEQTQVDTYTYNLIVRMMVYRCGKFMEIAIQYQEKKSYDWLKNIVNQYFHIYKLANEQFPDRIEWLADLLNYEWKE